MKIIELYVKNYRTLEKFDLSFSPTYSSICGKNDAGKSNIINVLCTIFSAHDSNAIFYENSDISIRNDFTRWKEDQEKSKSILFKVKIEIDYDRDAGVFEFIKTYLQLNPEKQKLVLVISISYSDIGEGEKVEVEVDGQLFTDLKAQEVLKKIRSSNSVLLHNSTVTTSPYRLLRGLEVFTPNMTPEYERMTEEISSFINEKLKGWAETQQREITELIGRLDSHFNVSLSVHEFDPGYLPFNITLGDENIKIPLEVWGSGTKNRTRILLTLFRARQISKLPTNANKVTPVIIIEEPESFLHPSAQAEFGRVLQCLAEDFDIQVIVTSHSPYMLSQAKPESNILLERTYSENHVRGTERIDTTGERWMSPFGLALGLNNADFEAWKDLFFSREQPMLLVEGDLDKQYIELLQNSKHGEKKVKFTGEIYPYGGKGFLQNNVMLRFIKNRFNKLVITYDLDAEGEVERNLITLGFVKDKDYFSIGIPESGKSNIEGLIPNEICSKVYGMNPDLISRISNGERDDRDRAKSEIKRLLFEEFKSSAKPGKDYEHFYVLADKINTAFGH